MNSLRLALGLMLALTAAVTPSPAAEPKLYSIPIKTIEGEQTTLQPYAGKVLLIVNVASQCGYTPQYEGLQGLYQKYQSRGLEVLGFPANDFGEQEPGSNSDIKQFCTARYHVTFPMFSKIHVVGPEQHPLYAALTGPQSPQPGPVGWNFNKILVSRDGKILAHFESDVEPDSAELTRAIEAALAK